MHTNTHNTQTHSHIFICAFTACVRICKTLHILYYVRHPYAVHTAYSVHCTSYNVRRTLYMVYCTLYAVHITYNTICTAYVIQSSYSVLYIPPISPCITRVCVSYTHMYASIWIRYKRYVVRCTSYSVRRTPYSISKVLCNQNTRIIVHYIYFIYLIQPYRVYMKTMHLNDNSHKHTLTHTYTHSRVYKHILTHTQTHSRTHKHTITHTQTHSRARKHTLTYTNTLTRI